MSYPPYGPDNGPSGNLPEDDWFRPAPNAGEEIYRASEYGRPQDQAASFGQEPYPAADPYGQNYDGYDDHSWDNDPNAGRAPQGAHANPSPHYLDDPTAPPTTLDAMQGEGPIDVPGRGGGDGGSGSGGGGGGRGGKSPREGWRRYVPNWKITVGVITIGALGMTTLVAVGYMTTATPDLLKDAQEDVTKQGTSVYWSGDKAEKGDKPILQLGEKRELVKIGQIPLKVRQAVLAAEQREFYTDGGISPKGLTRAVYNSVTGGEVQGGSTITQQLARNYLKGLSQERSLSRKYKEIFSAIKLDKKYSKDDILEAYLNTIDFGRNALGIQAASRAYFGTNVDKLNVYQGALLATMLNRPSYFQTQGNPKTNKALADAQGRWTYVLDGMRKKGWISQAEYDKRKWPKTAKKWVWTSEGGSVSYIRDRIEAELASIKGIDSKEIGTGGYRIYTTLQPKMMTYARDAVLENQPPEARKKKANIRAGLVAVNPLNGAIIGFYGGNPKYQSNAALVENPQMGSSFKPYVLATALDQGFNVNSLIEGRGHICLSRETGDVLPYGQAACKGGKGYWMDSSHTLGKAITLTRAMEQSINSSFVKLSYKVKQDEVIKMAGKMMNIDPATKDTEIDKQPSLALGVANIKGAAMRQAAGYSAFANGGTTVIPHVIKRITKLDKNGKEVRAFVLPWDKDGERVLTSDQAAQAGVAMKAVVDRGTGRENAYLPGRPAAGKTGTTDDGVAAWFVGYTPKQLSTAVTVFSANRKSDRALSETYGGDYPARIWHAFMTKALSGKPVEQFPPTTYTGMTEKWDKPPTKTATPKCDVALLDENGKCPKPGDGNEEQGKPGCKQLDVPYITCDPTKPPPGEEQNPPQWFCDKNPQWPTCAKNDPQPQPGDADGDGIPDAQDPDVDGDNIPNEMDPDYQKPNDNGNGNGNPNGGRLPTSWTSTPRDESLGN